VVRDDRTEAVIEGIDLDDLARAIAARMDPAALLEPADVGAMLKVCPRQVTDRYAKSPGFPAPVSLPTASGGRSQPRWQRADIVAWIASRKPGARKPGQPGRPRREPE
jgi:predicted DNA-binding transcriptional regulator AlpA